MIVTTDNKHYCDIACAIRAKNGTDIKYKPSEMASAIKEIFTGDVVMSEITSTQSASGGVNVANALKPIFSDATVALLVLSTTPTIDNQIVMVSKIYGNFLYARLRSGGIYPFYATNQYDAILNVGDKFYYVELIQ